MKHNYPQSEILSVGTIAKLGQFLKTAFRGLMVIIFAQKASLFSTLCTKKYALLLATVVLFTLSFTAKAQPGQHVINPAKDNSDTWIWTNKLDFRGDYVWALSNTTLFPNTNKHRSGLRIDVNPQNSVNGTLTSSFQYGAFRVYDDYRENFVSMVTDIRFGNSAQTLTYSGGNQLGDACTTTPVNYDSVSGIWTLVNVFKAKSPNTNRVYNIYQHITYHDGDKYFFIDC